MSTSRFWIMTLLLICVSGCGYNVKTIQDFGVSGKSLSDSFNEITTEVHKSCYQTALTTQITQRFKYSYSDAVKTASDQCKRTSDNNQIAKLYAAAISDYSTALAKLASQNTEFLDDEIKSLNTTADSLNKKDGTEIFKKEEISSIAGALKNISSLLTYYFVKNKTKSIIIESQTPINNVAEMLAVWLSESTNDVIKDSVEVSTSMSTSLTSASSVSSTADIPKKLPLRLAQADAEKQTMQAKELEKSVRLFRETVDAFKKANTELADKFDTLDKKQQLKKVLELVQKAKNLRDSVDDFKG